MHFEQPWVPMLLAGVPLLIWWRLRRPSEAALRFYAAEPATSLDRSYRVRLGLLPFWLRVAAVSLLIVALARPQTGGERTREPGRGIAAVMVLDRSGSMKQGIAYAGQHITRLHLAKQVFQQFVNGNGDALKGRGSDSIGIVAFARTPETVCPLTFSHESFAKLLDGVYPAERAEDRTAIGDAIALAGARLNTPAAREFKSRVIILLTDGQNNAGTRNVWEAARLVSRWGIRVHVIGIVGAAPATNSFLYRMNVQQRFASERDLGQLASMCGGIYRSVQDGDAINSVYAEIDRLEKSEVIRTRFRGGTDQFGAVVLCALTLLATAMVLSSTWLRRIP